MYDEFTFEATVDLKSFDYLIKPASQSRLRRALNLCIANRHQTKDDIADEQNIHPRKKSSLALR